MSQAASQAAAFYREVIESGSVWTIRDDGGFSAPTNIDGQRAQPFWSSRSRAERVIRSVAAYKDFAPVEIPLPEFRSRWLPGLAGDEVLVGLNWSGERATGYDVSARDAEQALAAAAR